MTNHSDENEVTYALLRSGQWGIRCLFVPKVGDVLTAVTKKGEEHRVAVTKIVWQERDGSCSLCAIKRVDGERTTPVPAAPPPSGTGGFQAVMVDPHRAAQGAQLEALGRSIIAGGQTPVDADEARLARELEVAHLGVTDAVLENLQRCPPAVIDAVRVWQAASEALTQAQRRAFDADRTVERFQSTATVADATEIDF